MIKDLKTRPDTVTKPEKWNVARVEVSQLSSKL